MVLLYPRRVSATAMTAKMTTDTTESGGLCRHVSFSPTVGIPWILFQGICEEAGPKSLETKPVGRIWEFNTNSNPG